MRAIGVLRSVHVGHEKRAARVWPLDGCGLLFICAYVLAKCNDAVFLLLL